MGCKVVPCDTALPAARFGLYGVGAGGCCVCALCPGLRGMVVGQAVRSRVNAVKAARRVVRDIAIPADNGFLKRERRHYSSVWIFGLNTLGKDRQPENE